MKKKQVGKGIMIRIKTEASHLPSKNVLKAYKNQNHTVLI